MREILFGFPEAVFLIFVSLLIAYLFWDLANYRQNRLKTLFDVSLCKTLLVPRSSFIFRFKVVGLILVWILATLALMQPHSAGRYPFDLTHPELEKKRNPSQEVVIALDLSQSMHVEDSPGKTSRLKYAQEVADEVISHLSGQNLALYAFTTTASRIVPSTLDYLFTRMMVNFLVREEPTSAGTAILKSLNEILNKETQRYPGQPRTVIILSDGEDTSSVIENLSVPQNDLIQIITVGFGSEAGGIVPGIESGGKQVESSRDDTLLNRIARQGNGSYFVANQETVYSLAKKIIERIEEQKKVDFESVYPLKESKYLVHDLYYQVPLGIALILLCFVLVPVNITPAWRLK